MSLAKSQFGEQSDNDRSNLGVILEPEVKLKLGTSYNNKIEDVCDSPNWSEKKVLSIGEVKELWKLIHGAESLKEMESTPRKKVYLHELLLDSELLIPKLEIPERNVELEKRISALKNSLAKREYQRMTKNVDFSSQFKPEDSIGFQMKQMNSALIAVLQFVISIGCAFFFGFMGVELIIGNLQLAVRLLLGIACALIVGAAELYFLAVNIAVSEDAYTAASTGLISPRGGSGHQHLKTS